MVDLTIGNDGAGREISRFSVKGDISLREAERDLYSTIFACMHFLLEGFSASDNLDDGSITQFCYSVLALAVNEACTKIVLTMGQF